LGQVCDITKVTETFVVTYHNPTGENMIDHTTGKTKGKYTIDEVGVTPESIDGGLLDCGRGWMITPGGVQAVLWCPQRAIL